MPLQTIAILYPGSMGSSLASTLSTRLPHLTLLTSVSDRSKPTQDRASSSGLTNVSMQELVHQSDIIISILPPSSALTLALEIINLLPGRPQSSPPIYVDLNAISPATSEIISSHLSSVSVEYIDGCVIGGPATVEPAYDPKIYLSSSAAYSKTLIEVAQVLGGGGKGKGLNVEVLEDTNSQGAASALKMCYGGLSKGHTGLATMLVLGESGAVVSLSSLHLTLDMIEA